MSLSPPEMRLYGSEILGPQEEPDDDDAGITDLVSARRAVLQRRQAVREMRAQRAADRTRAEEEGTLAGMQEQVARLRAGGGGGGGGGDYNSWVDEVARRKGLSPVERSAFAALGMGESGGRNIPQGIRDVNTAKGTPAFGPWQVIEPTFRANMDPDCTDWKNPVCSGLASINYQRKRYGRILSRPGY